MIEARINLKYKKTTKGKTKYIGLKNARRFLRTLPAKAYRVESYIKDRILYLKAVAV